MVVSTLGVSSAASTCSSAVRSSSPTSGPGSGTTRLPPLPQTMHSSMMATSNDRDVICSTRIPGQHPVRRVSERVKTPSPRRVMHTPLGRPVEPEVWIT